MSAMEAANYDLNFEAEVDFYIEHEVENVVEALPFGEKEEPPEVQAGQHGVEEGVEQTVEQV